MNTLLDTLDSREKSLDYVIGKINRSRKKIPEGRIRICSSHGRTQYYLLKDSSDEVGEYIKKKDSRRKNQNMFEPWTNTVLFAKRQQRQSRRIYQA